MSEVLTLDQVITYWNGVRSVTESFLHVFPPEHLDFRPIETVFTARDQSQHLIASQAMFVRGWTAGVWDFPWQNGRWVAREMVDESFDTIPWSPIDRAMALYAIDEEIHHRAQVGIYPRCLGIQPPWFAQRYQDLSRGNGDVG